MATPLSCALSNVHISSSHKRPSLETDLVLCDVSTFAWTCFPWINWVLEGKIHKFVLAFDGLKYSKNRGERPGPFYHVNNVSIYLGRQRGGRDPHQKNELEALSCRSCPKHWNFERSQSENVVLLFRNKEGMHEIHCFDRGSPLSPTLSTKVDIAVIHVIKWT